MKTYVFFSLIQDRIEMNICTSQYCVQNGDFYCQAWDYDEMMDEVEPADFHFILSQLQGC